MYLKLIPKLVFATLLTLAVFPAFSQVGPAATERTFPLSVGAGFSGFESGYGAGLLMGGSLWVDYTPPQVPRIIQGIGIEAEARDLNFHRAPDQPQNLRMDTIAGGVIYSWRHFDKFRPYGKFLIGFGNIDFGNYEITPPKRLHDTRTITALGGGVEYHAYRNIWARGDFQYQMWPDFWKNTTPAGALNPYGFTAGASYHF